MIRRTMLTAVRLHAIHISALRLISMQFNEPKGFLRIAQKARRINTHPASVMKPKPKVSRQTAYWLRSMN